MCGVHPPLTRSGPHSRAQTCCQCYRRSLRTQRFSPRSTRGLPARTHRRDNAGQLRPVLYAPKRVLHQIANETQARDHAQFRPGAQVSAVVLAGPVTSYRVDQLRPLTHDAVTFLRAGGAHLARAATAAEQALDAVGVSSRQPIRTATAATAPPHPSPAPPHMPGSLNRGTTPDTGIPR